MNDSELFKMILIVHEPSDERSDWEVMNRQYFINHIKILIIIELT